MAGTPVYVYRAIDGLGHVVDVYVRERRAAAAAATFFRRAIAATGVAPDEVATDCAAAYPPALAAVLPEVLHETGKTVQQRIARDHQLSWLFSPSMIDFWQSLHMSAKNLSAKNSSRIE